MPELEQSAELRGLVSKVVTDRELAESLHRSIRTRCLELYALYRSYQGFKRTHAEATPRDKDGILADGKRTFGGELFIPYCFWTVETIVPRLLSNHPQMNILPREPFAEENSRNMKIVVDAQQEQIGYGLLLQDPTKNGLIYGLGATKTGWKKVVEKRKELVRSRYLKRLSVAERRVETFNDPIVENVDVFDLIFDPDAAEIQDARFVIHRTWRDNAYVRRMIETRAWDQVPADDAETVNRLVEGGSPDRNESRNERMAAAGHNLGPQDRGRQHEVWEYHDGQQIITILDHTYCVRVIENPYWHGCHPFQVYRPTKVPNELWGIGEIEPIVHLQAEMNTLRQQRRDNATLVLQQAFAYAEGYIDVSKVRFGPAAMIPVQGDPRELLMPIKVGDIPNSGYQEEANLAADIERVTGISDNVIGRESQGQTATEAQLVTAAANVRIQNKTWRVEQELAKPCTEQFIRLNQQYITERPVPLPAEPEPDDTVADSRWSWVKFSAEDLKGLMMVVPVGGASAPENIPQMRADAQALWTAFGQDPQIDRNRLIRRVLELSGIKNPDAWVLPSPAPPIPPEALDWLVENGVDPAMIEAALVSTNAQSQQYSTLPPEEMPQPVVGGPHFSQAAIDAERKAMYAERDELESDVQRLGAEKTNLEEQLILDKARFTAEQTVQQAKEQAAETKQTAREQAAASNGKKPAASSQK